MPTVSGSLRPRDEMCRESQALYTPRVSGAVHPHDEVCRESQAPRTPQLQALRRFGHELNDSLRLCDGFATAQTMNSTTVSGPAQPHDELCRQSQALCTCPHNICGTSQALCAPMMNFADSLRLSAPPLITFVERLRLCADPCHNSQALRPPRRPRWLRACCDSRRLCGPP